jgi:hypothetical protein
MSLEGRLLSTASTACWRRSSRGANPSRNDSCRSCSRTPLPSLLEPHLAVKCSLSDLKGIMHGEGPNPPNALWRLQFFSPHYQRPATLTQRGGGDVGSQHLRGLVVGVSTDRSGEWNCPRGVQSPAVFPGLVMLSMQPRFQHTVV